VGNLTTSVKELEKANFLGFSISIFEKDQLITFIERNVDFNLKNIYYGHSLWVISNLVKQPNIYLYGEKADVLITDGRLFYLIAKFHGLPIKYNISIPQLVLLTLHLANKNNWSVFVLGGKETINKKAVQNIQSKHIGIKLVKGRDGYFSEDESENIINLINQLRFNVLLIGISSPKKEMIATIWKEKLNTNIIIPCGGMIDVLAGKTKITPSWIKKLGLASLYRFFQEPKRLFHKTLNTYCFILFRFLPIYLLKVRLAHNENFHLYKYFNNIK